MRLRAGSGIGLARVSRHASRATVLIAVLVASLLIPSTSAPTAHAATAPLWAPSRYMNTVDPNILYDLGCKLGRRDRDLPGTQDNLVVLMFGRPALRNDAQGIPRQGTILYSNQFASASAIAAAVQQFGRAYWACTSFDLDSTTRIVVGTSNNMGEVTAAHGTAWAQMVNDIGNFFIANGYSTQAHIAGGSDMELDWNGPGVTKPWVDAYDAINDWLLFNFGDAAGCPQAGATSTPAACNSGWNQEDVFYVSWGAAPAVPLPQIYRTDGAQARQWQQIKLYAYLRYPRFMQFQGALTQYNACLERTCDPSIRNTPEAGWTQLYDALNADTRTAQTVLTWSTDITWNTDPLKDP